MGALDDALSGLGSAKPAASTPTVSGKSKSGGGGALEAALAGFGGAGKSKALAKTSSSLESALAKINSSGDEGAAAKAEGIAHKVGQAVSPVVKVLQVLDLPRAGIVSGIGELVDQLDGGENTHGFIQGVKNHEGFGDLIKDSDIPLNVKRALGFTFDVALDPLTYLAPEAKLAHGGESVARQLLEKGAEQLGREGAEQAAAKVLRGGVSALSKEELASIGARGGLHLNVPGTGRLGRALGLAEEAKQIPILPFGVTKEVGKPLQGALNALRESKAGQFLAEHLGGETSELEKTLFGQSAKQAQKSGVAAKAIPALELRTTQRAARGLIRSTESKLVGEIQDIFKATGLKPEEGADLVRALEGDAKALGKLGEERVAPFAEWLEKARVDAGLPKINEYFPRRWSQELRDFLNPETPARAGGKEIPAAIRRELRQEGDTFLGETLHGSTQAELRDSIEQIAKDKFGDEYRKVFSDNPFEVLPLYARDAARKIGRNEVLRQLEAKGLLGRAAAAAPTPTPAVTEQLGLDFKGAAQTAKAEKAEAARVAANQARVASAQEAMRSVNEWAVSAARDAAPWKRQIADIEKTIKKLEERLGKQANRGVIGDTAALEARLSDLYKERDLLQRRVDTTEGLLADDREFAQNLLDSAQKAAQAPSPEEAVRQLNENAQLQLDLFPEGTTVEQAPKVLAKTKEQPLIFEAPLEALFSFKNSMTPEDLADALARVQHYTTPEGWHGFLKTFDKITNLWKAYSILTPGFHIRNFVGGVFNNALAGVEYGSYRKWLRIKLAHDAAVKAGEDGLAAVAKKFGQAEAEKLDQILKMGILNEGQTAAEAVQGYEAGGKVKGNLNPLSNKNKVIEASARRGENVENTLRGTLAYDVLSKGRSADEALADVYKFHFDYSDLSKFEKNVAKRVIPFYTWTRKNFPLQLEQMARNPGQYVKYLHAKRNIELGTPEESIVPSYFGDLLGIHLPFQLNGSDAYLTPDLPFKSLEQTVSPAQILSQVNPIFKTPLELQAGKQFFSGIPFTGKYSEAPATWTRIPGLFPALQKFGKAEKNQNGKYVITDATAYTIEQFLPVLGRVRRLAPSEDKYQERAISSWLGVLFGTGVRTNTESSKTSEVFRRKDQLDSIINQLKARGVIAS